MTSLGKVAVLLGGRSSEREISLRSGEAVLSALIEAGVDAIAFDPAERPLCQLVEMGIDRVFIALHGRFGEDGAAQGALDMLNIPYTGSGCIASGVAMDKYKTKLIWRAVGLPTPEYMRLTADTTFEEVVDWLGLPFVVKPSVGGSTLGITKVTQASEFAAAYEKAAVEDSRVFAEAFVAGDEYTATLFDGRPLPLVKIEAPGGNYDYHHKYFSDETRYLCPCGLPPEQELQLQAIAFAAFDELGCCEWGRVDFILDENGMPQLLEVNTVPGMTEHSLAPMAAQAAGISFTDLIIQLLEEAHVG